MAKLHKGIGLFAGASSSQSWSSFWASRTIANYFVDGFSGANILDSSGNGFHAISRNTGSFVGDGTAYFLITGLLTTDTITALSADIPTCTTNGRLDIANGKVVYGITVTRSGVIWAYYPVCEKKGICLHDVSGNKRHGTMTSGSDARWQVVDLPTNDYLRDNGCSRNVYMDGVLKLTIPSVITRTTLTTQAWQVKFDYKLNNEGGLYFWGGDTYLLRVNATTLRFRSTANVDFNIAVPMSGNLSISHDGMGNYSATINGVTANVVTTARVLSIYRFASNGSTPINGYMRNFQVYHDGALVVDIPDLYTGYCNVRNQKIVTTLEGTLSQQIIPANIDKLTDADGFIITHPQNGHQVIPGTFFSLPANADLIAACENVTLNDYYADGTPNIIEAESIGHYDPKSQYYDWVNRDNLIIVKDGVTISDSDDLRKIKELHYWGTYIADAFAVDNSHIPTVDLNHYKLTIETLLHPNYTDSASTGYYYTTFGPEGLKRTDSVFFMLFFHSGNITAAANTPFNAAILSTTPRLNVGGDVFEAAVFSNHTYTNDYIFMTSIDNWKMAGVAFVSLSLGIGSLTRNIQSFRKHYSVTTLTVGGNTTLNCDITNYPYKSDMEIQFNNTQVYGTFPSSLIHSLATIAVMGSGVSKFGFTSITNSIGTIDLRNAPILSSEMDRLFAMLNACFTANAPTKPLQILLYGFPTGYLTGGVANTDYVNIKALFTAAGQTLTLNEEWLLDKPTALNEASIVITHDDWFIQNQSLLPIYLSRGIKPTCYCTTTYLTSEIIYAGASARWGKIASWSEANNLRVNYGWDMQCHGYLHGSIDAANMILADADHLSHFGVTPDHIAYPSGGYTDEMIAEINPTYRKTGRRATTSDDQMKAAYNGLDTDLMKLACVNCDIGGEINPSTDFARLKYSMDVIAEDKLNIIILIHGVPEDGTGRDMTIAQVAELLDYAISKGIAIKTIKEFYEEDLV